MKEAGTRDLRQFGIILGVVLGSLGFIYFMRGRLNTYPWFLGFAAAALLSGIFIPRALKPVFFVFTKVTRAIGWFNTRVILVLVYYLLLTPIGLLIRIFRNDPLDQKIDRAAESYWIKRKNASAGRRSLEEQF